MSALPEMASIPELFCPVPARWYPDAVAVGEESCAWLRSFDLPWPAGQWEEIEADRMGYWFCLLAPGAVSPTRMRVGADMFTSIFPYDDAYSGRFAIGSEREAVTWAGRWCRLLDDPGFAIGCDHPVTEAVADFLRRMAMVCTDTQYRRFADALKTYMWGVAWEFAGHDQRVWSNFNDAAACRMYAAGALPTVALLHATHDLNIPDAEFYRPEVRAFTEATSFLIAVHNDLFSYSKERLDDSDKDVSLLNVALAEGCTMTEAVTRLIVFSNQIMARLVELRDALAPGADEDLLRYLDASFEMLAGHLEFEQHCARYLRGSAQLPPLGITPYLPADTPTGPPAVPTVAWWWDLSTRVPAARRPARVPVAG